MFEHPPTTAPYNPGMISSYIASRRLRSATRVSICLLIISVAIDCTPLRAGAADTPNQPPASVHRSEPVPTPESSALGVPLYKVEPEYPQIAKAARISGIVTLRATISKAGIVTNLRAICGPQLLQDASVKAVQQWKYRPYLVRGEPVEVETTIRVTFALGGKKKLKFSKDSCPEQ